MFLFAKERKLWSAYISNFLQSTFLKTDEVTQRTGRRQECAFHIETYASEGDFSGESSVGLENIYDDLSASGEEESKTVWCIVVAQQPILYMHGPPKERRGNFTRRLISTDESGTSHQLVRGSVCKRHQHPI